MALPEVDTFERPPPPDDMAGPAQYVWRKIMETTPPGWFTIDTFPVLERLCTVIVWTKQLEATFNANGRKFDDGGVEYARASKLLGELARHLRLTLRSRKLKYSQAATRIKRFAAKPETTWDADSDEKEAA
jgi:hypothetical protein